MMILLYQYVHTHTQSSNIYSYSLVYYVCEATEILTESSYLKIYVQ